MGPISHHRCISGVDENGAWKVEPSDIARFCDNIQGMSIGCHSWSPGRMDSGITKSAIRRLARRGGVKRISGLIYETPGMPVVLDDSRR